MRKLVVLLGLVLFVLGSGSSAAPGALQLGQTFANGDSDGDGWSDSDEVYLGTDPLDACADTPAANDEDVDAHPRDFNDDQFVDAGDVLAYAGWFPHPPPVPVRLDLDPNGIIDTQDMLLFLAGYETPPASCSPDPPPPLPLGPSSIDQVGIDLDPSGNSAGSLGSIETCIEKASSDPNFDIDIYIKDVPADSPVAGFNGAFNFPATVVNVVAGNGSFFLNQKTGSSVMGPAGPWTTSPGSISVVDWGPYPATSETGQGVLVRLTLDIVGSGSGTLCLGSAWDPLRVWGNGVVTGPYPVAMGGVARIAVDEACTPPPPDSDGDCALDVDDNCPTVYNPGQENFDGDQWGDACDNCPNDPNPGQENFDGDQWGDACDLDDDNDRYRDGDETSKGSLPLNAASAPEHCEAVDNDADTSVDEGYDLTRPGGGAPNGVADCVEDVDTDGDTIFNPVDPNDDANAAVWNDGFLDAAERCMTTDELDACPELPPSPPNPWGAPKDDAWPPDINMDRVVDTTDAGLFFMAFPSAPGSAAYTRRLDMAGCPGVIDTSDAGVFLGRFPGACPLP